MWNSIKEFFKEFFEVVLAFGIIGFSIWAGMYMMVILYME